MRPSFRILALVVASLLPESLHAQVTQRTISDGKISDEYFVPTKTPAPAIFVLHTAYGKVHSADVAMAKALAEAGFVAFAINYPLSPDRTWIASYLAWTKARPEVAGQPLGAVGLEGANGASPSAAYMVGRLVGRIPNRKENWQVYWHI